MTPQESNSVEILRRIHIGRLLGKGGMAHVVDGFDSALGQYLAVKQLLPEFIKNPEAQARFEEEAAIMAAIDHPGVLPVYGMGTDADRGLYYVMKKVEGKTLEQIISDPQEPASSVQRRTRLLAMLLDVSIWPLRIAILAGIATNLEATAMTHVLPEWTADLLSIFHARAHLRNR